MKHTTLFFITVLASMFFSKNSHAQTSTVVLDSIWVGTRSLQGIDETLPPSVNDIAWNNRKVELNIIFYVKNPQLIQTISVKYGTANGLTDLALFSLNYLKENGKEYLVHNNKKFMIWKNKICINQVVPYSYVTSTGYAIIQAKDINNLYSNSINKKFN